MPTPATIACFQQCGHDHGEIQASIARSGDSCDAFAKEEIIVDRADPVALVDHDLMLMIKAGGTSHVSFHEHEDGELIKIHAQNGLWVYRVGPSLPEHYNAYLVTRLD